MRSKVPSLCLVNPPHPYLSQPRAQLPLGMLYVGSMARAFGSDVSYVDLSDTRPDRLAKAWLPEADVYGVTATILDRDAAHAVAREVRRRRGNTAAVVVGGPLTVSPEHVDTSVFHSVVAGEGEYAIRELLADFPRIRRRYNGGRIRELDGLPFPARELVSGGLGGRVFAGGKEHVQGGSTVLTTSRGCPFDCVYCASPGIWGRKIVYRSPTSVLAEIDEVIRRHGVRQFRLSDDNLTTDRHRVEVLCEYLSRRDIAWRASIRVWPNDRKLFDTMRRGGCAEVSFGVESGDQDVLHSLRKKTTVQMNKDAVHNAKAAGLDVRVLFMIGTPGETADTVDRNIEFFEDVKDDCDAIAVTNFVPLPGCEVARAPEKCGVELLPSAGDVNNYNLCLYGPEGQNRWLNLVRPVGISEDRLTDNKRRMVEYIQSTGKSNMG